MNKPVIFVLLNPVCPPVNDGVLIIGIDHEYKVPGGIIPLKIFVGVIVKETPLQVTVVTVLIIADG